MDAKGLSKVEDQQAKKYITCSESVRQRLKSGFQDLLQLLLTHHSHVSFMITK